jgi:hypothetical protein
MRDSYDNLNQRFPGAASGTVQGRTLPFTFVCAALSPFAPKAAEGPFSASISGMIRKLKSGQFRLYSRKKDSTTGKRKNLGTFSTLDQAKQHEREVQYFKKH